jgi:hypothetical protein
VFRNIYSRAKRKIKGYKRNIGGRKRNFLHKRAFVIIKGLLINGINELIQINI